MESKPPTILDIPFDFAVEMTRQWLSSGPLLLRYAFDQQDPDNTSKTSFMLTRIHNYEYGAEPRELGAMVFVRYGNQTAVFLHDAPFPQENMQRDMDNANKQYWLNVMRGLEPTPEELLAVQHREEAIADKYHQEQEAFARELSQVFDFLRERLLEHKQTGGNAGGPLRLEGAMGKLYKRIKVNCEVETATHLIRQALDHLSQNGILLVPDGEDSIFHTADFRIMLPEPKDVGAVSVWKPKMWEPCVVDFYWFFDDAENTICEVYTVLRNVLDYYVLDIQDTSVAPDVPTSPTGNAGKGQNEEEEVESRPTTEYLARLRQNIVDCFNLDELRTLCFDLGIKYENLATDTLDGKARELVDYCKRVGKIPDLVAKCRKRRPNVPWEDEA